MFVPVKSGGGALLRVKDGKAYAVTGTKDHKWVEASVARDNPDLEIDYSYFTSMAEKAREAIEKFGSFKELVS